MQILKGADDRIVEAGQGTVAGTVATPLVVLRMLLLGGVLAAMLGAGPLSSWAEGFDAGTGPGAFAVEAVRRWYGAMGRLGAAGPYNALHASLKRLETRHF